MGEREVPTAADGAQRLERLEGAVEVSSLLERSAWRSEPEPLDEVLATPWAEPGWHSWNAMSPEVEVCDFVVALADVLRPTLVVETGTGQGFLTRRIEQRLRDGQRLVCFESHPEWRKALATLDFFDGRRCVLSGDETPDDETMASAELCVLDSDFAFRLPEIQRWWRNARPDAVVVVHDTGNGHAEDTEFALARATVVELGIPGFFLGNPRGAFVGHKPTEHEATPAAASGYVANRLVEVETQLRALRSTRTFRYTAGARRFYGGIRQRLSSR